MKNRIIPSSSILDKVLNNHTQTLNNTELLTVLFGRRSETLIAQILDIQTHKKTLRDLYSSDWQELKKLGLKATDYARLHASLTLTQRLISEPLYVTPVFDLTHTVKEYCISSLSHQATECCLGLFLNARHQLICIEQLSQGTTDQASVYTREIIKKLIKHHACALIFVHNHPSGSLEPSQADINFTVHLSKVLQLLEIRLLDHILVAGNQALSFAEKGLMHA